MSDKVFFLMDSVIFKRLPLPISVNEYCNRKYPTSNKVRFVDDFWHWRRSCMEDLPKKVLSHLRIGDRLLEEFRDRTAMYSFKVQYTWVRRMTTKDKKKMLIFDPSNYIKCMEDQISELLTIDDLYFKDVSIRCYHDPASEYFNAQIFKPELIRCL